MTAPNPAIVLISEHHVDTLAHEFGRYANDYDLYPCTSARQAFECTRDVVVAGGQVAMVVTESVLPDADVHMAFHKLREKVPTTRRVVATHWEHFIADGPAMRAAMAKGKLDAYLLMPRGARDEEFHNAITDLLSDWGSTVPDPEVVSVKIISPTRDPLTMAIRDFLSRMAMPSKVWEPDTRGGPPRHRAVRRRAGVPPRLRAGPAADRRSLGARRGHQHLRRAHGARPQGGRRRRRGRCGTCRPRLRGLLAPPRGSPPSSSRRKPSAGRPAPAR